MADTCQSLIGSYLLPPAQSLADSRGCDQPAVVTLRAGCVHEHIKIRRYCAEHGQPDLVAGQWICRECAALGHDCPTEPEVVQEDK